MCLKVKFAIMSWYLEKYTMLSIVLYCITYYNALVPNIQLYFSQQ